MTLFQLVLRVSIVLVALMHAITVVASNNDADGDGVSDQADNCVLIANVLQTDIDGDGWGNRCDADYNNDGVVNFIDFSLLSSAFLTDSIELDLSGDEFINFSDISIFTSLFGQTPGPAGYANWVQSGDGSWAEPNNWFPSAVPPVEAHVVIDVASKSIVTFAKSAGNLAISSLSLSETLDIATNSQSALRVNGNVVVNGAIILSGGALDVGGVLQLNGPLQFEGGRLANATVLNSNPPLQTSPFALAQFDNVVLKSDLEIVNGSVLAIRDGLTLNDANVRLDCDDSFAELALLNELTVSGDGAIDFIGTGDSLDACRITNFAESGPVTIDAGITIKSVFSSGKIGQIGHELELAASVESHVAGKTVEVVGDILNVSGSVSAQNDGTIVLGGAWANQSNANISASNGSLQLAGNWINYGTIEAANSHVQLGHDASIMWQNDGSISLTESPTTLRGSFELADLGSYSSDQPLVIEGVLDNSERSLDLATDSVVELLLGDGGTILGGVLTGEEVVVGPSINQATLDGVVLHTDVIVGNFSQLDIRNNLTLVDSDIRLHCDSFESYLRFVGNQSLSGNGEIIFDGINFEDDACQVQVPKGDALHIDSNVVITTGNSGGQLGSVNDGEITLAGNVESSLVNRSIQVAGNSVQIFGELSAINGGILVVDGNWINHSGARIGVAMGELELSGQWTNYGVIEAFNSSVVLGGNDQAWSNEGSIELIASPTELFGQFNASNLLSLSSDGLVTVAGTLVNSDNVLNLDQIDIADLRFGRFPFLGFGRIEGGTITGSQPMIVDRSKVLILRDVSFATDLSIDITAEVIVEQSIKLLSADIIMNCGFDPTELNAIGNSIITGNGTIQLRQSSPNSFGNKCQLTPRTVADSMTIDSGVSLETFGALSFIRIGNRGGAMTILSDMIVGGPVPSISFYGEPLSLAGKISNPDVFGAQFTFDGDWEIKSSGKLELYDSPINLYGNWTNFGTIEGAFNTVEIGDPDENPSLQSFSNQGMITLTDSPVELFGTYHPSDLGQHFFDRTVNMRGVIVNSNRIFDLETISGEVTLGNQAVLIGGVVSGSSPLVVDSRLGLEATIENTTLATDVLVSSADFNERGLNLSGTVNLFDANVLMECPDAFGQPVRTRLTAIGSTTISGNGSVIFDGNGLAEPSGCQVYQQDSLSAWTIENGVSIRTGTGSGFLGSAKEPLNLTLDGAVISDAPTSKISVIANEVINNGEINAMSGSIEIVTEDFLHDGLLSVAGEATIRVDSNQTNFTTDATTDVAIGSTGSGVIEFSSAPVQVAGTINFFLQNGFTPTECDTFSFMTYPSFEGGFDNVTGPDLGNGNTFSVEELDTEAIAVTPGIGC